MKRSVVVVITNIKNEVLLLQRSDGHPMYPLQWCFAGGKLDWITEDVSPKEFEVLKLNHRWEDYEEAAFRETLEELGIVITSFEHRGEWLADEQFLVKVFHATVTVDPTRDFPNREHIAWGWFNEFNLPQLKPTSMTAVQLKKRWPLSQEIIDKHG